MPSSVVLEKQLVHRNRRPLRHPIGLMQMLAALWFSSYFFFGLAALYSLLLLVYFSLLSTQTALLLLLCYVGQMVLYRPQRSNGWPFAWLLYSPIVDLVLSYYNSSCIREGPPLDPKGQYLFAMSPHGIFGVCRAFSGGTLWKTLFPDITARWGSFGGAFFIPGVREFSLCCGCVDASRPVLEKAIKRGENIMLIPGGTRELMLTDGNSRETQLVLLERKGFVKLAIKHGLQLVPGFCFGEKWVHDIILLPERVRTFLHRRFKIAGCTLAGRWYSFVGKIAKADGTPISLGYVWGEPIEVQKMESCPSEYVDQIHREYMQAVTSIFERNKRSFGYSDDEKLLFVSAR
ncbi:MAG: hypothetical protein SGPRY_000189 [Prymnesium sp.]